MTVNTLCIKGNPSVENSPVVTPCRGTVARDQTFPPNDEVAL